MKWGRSLSGSYLEDRRTAHFGRREQEAGVSALAAERFERRLVIVWLVRCLRDSLLPASDAARLLPDARARPSSAPLSICTSAVIHLAMSVGPQACLTRHHCNLKFCFTHQHLKTRVCLISSLGFPCSQGLSGRIGSLF